MNLLYLPIVTTADGLVVGVEASAEGADALLEACVDVRDWTLEQPFRQPLTLDVRMSTAELTDPTWSKSLQSSFAGPSCRAHSCVSR
jgi:hypothetical protein